GLRAIPSRFFNTADKEDMQIVDDFRGGVEGPLVAALRPTTGHGARPPASISRNGITDPERTAALSQNGR
ncbi:hypothetical protein AB4Y33_42460, partial [Paraburkholderia sp. BR14319]|uniref:hypothetical protein n=1 Tax=Paraburkholderia sp. BR14319 TaxID=3237005 RepID=UPI0034D24964